MLLSGKTVIVTGGANGIGRAYCEHLAVSGAFLVIADVDFESGNALADYINQIAGLRRATAVQIDVTSERDTLVMAQTALENFGRIDVLINNAGTYPHVEFEKITYDDWRSVIATNLDSVFLCTKAVLPYMKENKSGKIINVATNLVWIGLAGMVHYVASKAAIIGFTRSLAREIGEYGITVNALAPGAIIPPVEQLDKWGLARAEAIVTHQCVKWCQRPEDLIGPMLFLASSDSDFMSGQVVTVDGGLTNH